MQTGIVYNTIVWMVERVPPSGPCMTGDLGKGGGGLRELVQAD